MKNWSRMARMVWGLLIVCLMLGIVPGVQAAPQYVSIAELCEEVAGGWHQTYEAHGRTVVVDIDSIGIPDVNTIPVLTVRGADPARTDALPAGEVRDNRVNNLLFSVGSNPENNFADPKKMQSKPGEVFYADTVDMDYHAEGNPMSVADAMELVKGFIASAYGQDVSNELSIMRVAMSTKLYRYNAKTQEYGDAVDHPDNMGTYEVNLYQSFYSMPVLWQGGGDFDYLKGEAYGLSSRVIGYVCRPNNFAVNATIVQEDTLRYEDVPLLPFEEIKPIIEKLIADGRVRGIQSVRLGYVLYHDPKDKNINWAVPTWVCRAEFYDDANQQPFEDMSSGQLELVPRIGNVYIQAQTGKFADPLNTSKDRRNVSKIITWNEVK